jgi:hypothetical protein
MAASTHKVVRKRMLAITYRDLHITPKRDRSQSRPEKHNMREKQGGEFVKAIREKRGTMRGVLEQHCSHLPISSSTRIHPSFANAGWT